MVTKATVLLLELRLGPGVFTMFDMSRSTRSHSNLIQQSSSYPEAKPK